jgi:MFS family permease
LPRTVIVLGVASLLTDLSSEMIYPLLPVFLSGVLGAGPAALGVIEGVAEATSALLKAASGWWADRVRRRKPFVVLGYGLSGLLRPLIGLAGSWPVVAALRFGDRIGKGLRGAPRDALIADVTPADRRGAAYGLHRAMDHAGAVGGPLVAAALLRLAGFSLREVFLLAAIPAAVVVLVLVLGVREEARPPARPAARPSPAGSRRELGDGFRRFLLAQVVFTLGNSTDAFLLLALSSAGVPVTWVALLWSLHHVVKMVATYAGGRLSDRTGRRPMVLAGWTVYGVVYLGFAAAGSPAALVALFLVYGIYFGLTEPVEKAWVVELVPARQRGTALGLYHGAVGLGALPASLLFGALWKLLGAPAAFLTGAVLALAAALLLLAVPATGPGDD